MKKPVTSQKNVYSKTTIQQEHKINTAPRDTCSIYCLVMTLVLYNSIKYKSYLLPYCLHIGQNSSSN